MAIRFTKIRLSMCFLAIFLLVGTIWMWNVYAPFGMFSTMQNLEKRFIETPNERWDEDEWKNRATLLVSQIIQVQNSFDYQISHTSKGSLDADKIMELEALITQVKVLKAFAENSIGAEGLK